MYKKIFIDTNPIIYFLQKTEPYSSKVKSFLLESMNNNSEFYTSTITDAEFAVKPLKEKKFEDIETYRSFLQTLNVLKTYVNESVAFQAAKLRAKYESIKLADALQLAAGIDSGCDAFLSNDKQLKQVSEINVVCLDEINS